MRVFRRRVDALATAGCRDDGIDVTASYRLHGAPSWSATASTCARSICD
jgi:hypothetical protein